MKNFTKSPPVYISHLQVLTWVWCSWRHTLTKAQKWSQYKTKRYLNIFFFFPGSMESWSISLASLSLLTSPFMLFGNILFWDVTVNSCFQECALATIIPFQMTPEIKSNHDSFLVDGCALRADMDIGYVPSSSTAVGEVLHCCTYMRQHSSCV